MHSIYICIIILPLIHAFVPIRKSSSWSPFYSTSIKNPEVTSLNDDLESICNKINSSLQQCVPDIIKTCKVKVGLSPLGHRLGLWTKSTDTIKEGETLLAIPYDDQFVFTSTLALQTVWKSVLPQGYNGWTGDVGLIALLILNELAKNAHGNYGIPLPTRKQAVSELINAWIHALPTPKEMSQLHPLLWDEDAQEILQSSTTNKIYRLLDDLEEDASWLQDKIWSKDRDRFPEKVSLQRNGHFLEYPCFSLLGFRWAYSIAASRSVYLDGSLRLIPVMDFANHSDNAKELVGGGMGAFGSTKGALLRFTTDDDISSIKDGGVREIFVSYGPKTAAEYLLEHGFIPNQAKTTVSAASLTFEIDSEDRFYEDKMDVLEFETYDSAPMEPIQTFDIVSQVGRESEPDPSMIQFLRLAKLGGFDAFLLESVFRKQVWGFMSMPVSEKNERDVLDTIVEVCTRFLNELDSVPDIKDGDNSSQSLALCSLLRKVERKVLTRTIEYVNRDKEALDLKEYYQQRRLKDLGLDSEWVPEDDVFKDNDDYYS